MMFFTQNTIILSVIAIFSLAQLITCADPEPASVPADPTKPASVSNGGSNIPEPAKIAQPSPINIVTKPTSTQQSLTTPNKENLLCKIIFAPLTFFKETVKSIWKSLLMARDNIISIYRPPVRTVNNVVG
ncbi:Uncharacterized protein FWK35_00007574 [Aphis craccivora]|uniref:Salivary secreted peptide n=1 Tax=Aphis craccivora TaxID=307492 RepID=A0A6G0YTJ4_APHCR|nr:Uncharacterized protein FWK35_00007574 [Aphis craccivora]